MVDLRIDMPPVLWTLRRGDRLRLEISSSSFPSFVQHPNVDRDRYRQTDPRPAEQTLHLLPERPARLVLRIDASRFREPDVASSQERKACGSGENPARAGGPHDEQGRRPHPWAVTNPAPNPGNGSGDEDGEEELWTRPAPSSGTNGS